MTLITLKTLITLIYSSYSYFPTNPTTLLQQKAMGGSSSNLKAAIDANGKLSEPDASTYLLEINNEVPEETTVPADQLKDLVKQAQTSMAKEQEAVANAGGNQVHPHYTTSTHYTKNTAQHRTPHHTPPRQSTAHHTNHNTLHHRWCRKRPRSST